MGAKYDVDEVVTINGKVSVVTSDETGTIYQVKIIANDVQLLGGGKDSQNSSSYGEQESYIY